MSIKLQGHPGKMACTATEIPGFPGSRYVLAYPESIGDAGNPSWYGGINPTWEESPSGAWISRGEQAGHLTYELTMSPGTDCVTTEFKLTNLGKKTWQHGMAFNCLQCAYDADVRDNECLRTWVRTGGEFKRLVELPRVFGPRPALQLYSVEGAPLGKDIAFVADFKATPEVVIEPWMAMVSRDGNRLVATVSKPGLFLFQNREYSCIHCGTGFNQVKPGATATALNKVYFFEGNLSDWYRRMTNELA